MQKKTLGGDRLGSGKKMQVELHGYERSTQDMGYIWRSTMSAGTLVPFLVEVALPGDTFDIDLDCDIKTLPTIGPLFGSEKVQLDVFQAPIRLYNALLHNNALGIGMQMSSVKFPVLRLTATPINESQDVDNAQINPSSIMAYLGLRGVGVPGNTGPVDRDFNAIPYLAYAEIYKNYYANKQEEIGAVIHTAAIAVPDNIEEMSTTSNEYGTQYFTELPQRDLVRLEGGMVITIGYSGAVKPVESDIYLETTLGIVTFADIATFMSEWTPGQRQYLVKSTFGKFAVEGWRYRNGSDIKQGPPKVATFPLENIDKMRENILSFHSKVAPFNVKAQNLTPYSWLFEQPFGSPNLLSTQEGLLLKTYQSDLFNNWLQTEWIDGPNGISAITAVDVSSGELNLDTLNLSKKVYDMLNRIAVSGGTYDDWLDVQYDHDRFTRAESPMYMGGLIKELVFQEVVSNAAAEGATGNQALGSLAGKGVMSKKHKGGKIVIKVDEPSYIIGIVSLTPRIDYSQGNKWDVHLKTMDDLHKPALDEIGFQELITEQLHWADTTFDSQTGVWGQRSAGKQPAWMNYMTNVNRTLGNFAIAENQMFMTFNRRYELNFNGIIKDLTTYIDPVKFNYIFAESSLDAQNYMTQIAVDMIVRRKMSAKIMPNL